MDKTKELISHSNQDINSDNQQLNTTRPVSITMIIDSGESDDEFHDAEQYISDENDNNYETTDANPLGLLKKSALRRQPNVYQTPPPTPQTEVTRSPVPDRHAREYNMNFPKRGIAVIFNHENFAYESKRLGTERDWKRLDRILNMLDFTVQIHHDLTAENLKAELRKLAAEDHSKNDCVLIAVLSHGKNGTIHAKDKEYRAEKLWESFTSDKCKTLAGKPKLFIIQACKGDNVDHGTLLKEKSIIIGDTVDSIAASRRPTIIESFYTIPNSADILIATATPDGYYAWRNPTEGSWYIKMLCEELEKHHENEDFNTILTFVSRRVAIECESCVPNSILMDKKKQIPCVISMLTRLIYLRKKPPQNSVETSQQPFPLSTVRTVSTATL